MWPRGIHLRLSPGNKDCWLLAAKRHKSPTLFLWEGVLKQKSSGWRSQGSKSKTLIFALWNLSFNVRPLHSSSFITPEWKHGSATAKTEPDHLVTCSPSIVFCEQQETESVPISHYRIQVLKFRAATLALRWLKEDERLRNLSVCNSESAQAY
jgi:hypothetical protein